MPRKQRQSQLPSGTLGRHGDNPEQILESALDTTRRDPRLGAEQAYLGIHTALENAVGTTFKTDSAQVAAISKLAKRNKKLAGTFNELKRELHGLCFYQGVEKCDGMQVAKHIGRAQEWLTNLPKKL